MTFAGAAESADQRAFEAFMTATEEPDPPGWIRRSLRALRRGIWRHRVWRRRDAVIVGWAALALLAAGSPFTPLAGAESVSSAQGTQPPATPHWADSTMTAVSCPNAK